MWRNFLLVLIIFILGCGILYSAISQLDPLGSQRTVALLAFFIGVFAVSWAFSTACFFFVAEIFASYQFGISEFLVAARRGVWSSNLVLIAGILRVLDLLGWIEGFLLLVFFGLLEWIFMTGKNENY